MSSDFERLVFDIEVFLRRTVIKGDKKNTIQKMKYYNMNFILQYCDAKILKAKLIDALRKNRTEPNLINFFFGIKSHCILAKSVPKNYHAIITSSISTAFMNLNICIPFFISTNDNSSNLIFSGKFFNGREETFYSSHYENIEENKSISKIIETAGLYGEKILNRISNDNIYYSSYGNVQMLFSQSYKYSLLSICCEWPFLPPNIDALDFHSAPYIAIAFEPTSMCVNKSLRNLLSFAQNLLPSWDLIRRTPCKEVPQSEIKKSFFLYNSICPNLQNRMAKTGTFFSKLSDMILKYPLIWDEFLQWIKICSEQNQPLINGISDISSSDCLLEQKIHQLNLAIQNKKNPNSTNYQLCDDQISIINEKIKIILNDVHFSNTEQIINQMLICKYQNFLFEDYYKKYPTFHPIEILKRIWDSIPDEFFNSNIQKQVLLQFFNNLSPRELFGSLVLIKIGEIINQLSENNKYSQIIGKEIQLISHDVMSYNSNHKKDYDDNREWIRFIEKMKEINKKLERIQLKIHQINEIESFFPGSKNFSLHLLKFEYVFIDTIMKKSLFTILEERKNVFNICTIANIRILQKDKLNSIKSSIHIEQDKNQALVANGITLKSL